MSLLDEAMETYTIINRATIDDGYGGTIDTWSEGATFQGAMVFNSSVEALTAQAQGVKSLYRLTTRKATVLEYHTVIRRERDKKIFRVTSDGDDEYTPQSATLDMRQVTCEEWKLSSEVVSDG